LLRDADGDGIAEKREVFMEGLNQPFGMALLGGYMTIVEQWRQLPDGQIEFTMRRLRAAD
jgi:glucose/arabinose dehydrogenase